MLSKIIAFFVELFRSKPKKQKDLESRVDKINKQIEEVENEKLSDDDIVSYINDDK